MTNITVVVKEPNQPAHIATIDNMLRSLQAIVGGYVESIAVPGTPKLTMLVNEDGHRLNLQPNCMVPAWNTRVVGTIILVSAHTSLGGDFSSLTPDEAAATLARFTPAGFV